MIHRLVSVPLSSSNFREEVSVIKYLDEINDLNLDIDSLIQKKRTTFVLDSTTTNKRNLPKKKWIKLPFLGRMSSAISRVLKRFNFRPDFYTGCQ